MVSKEEHEEAAEEAGEVMNEATEDIGKDESIGSYIEDTGARSKKSWFLMSPVSVATVALFGSVIS